MMRKFLRLLLISMSLIGSMACAPARDIIVSSPTIPTAVVTVRPHSCKATLDDGVSPSYKPDAPERTVVGKGHVVTGVVISSADCRPIANAQLEFWSEEQGLGHPDSSRATFFTAQDGRYRFECNLPEHIPMRISAPGYKTIGVNSYHPDGKTEGIFDIVLEPEK